MDYYQRADEKNIPHDIIVHLDLWFTHSDDDGGVSESGESTMIARTRSVTTRTRTG